MCHGCLQRKGREKGITGFLCWIAVHFNNDDDNNKNKNRNNNNFARRGKQPRAERQNLLRRGVIVWLTHSYVNGSTDLIWREVKSTIGTDRRKRARIGGYDVCSYRMHCTISVNTTLKWCTQALMSKEKDYYNPCVLKHNERSHHRAWAHMYRTLLVTLWWLLSFFCQ